MNERIKELAEQAGVLFDTDPTYTYGASPKVLERFAELVRQNECSRCVKIIENYQIPVGNSSAGEIACEMTYAALRDIRDQIKGRTE